MAVDKLPPRASHVLLYLSAETNALLAPRLVRAYGGGESSREREVGEDVRVGSVRRGVASRGRPREDPHCEAAAADARGAAAEQCAEEAGEASGPPETWVLSRDFEMPHWVPWRELRRGRTRLFVYRVPAQVDERG